MGLFCSQLLQVSAFAQPLFPPLPSTPPPSKLVEANHPSVVPPQWLPVLLANAQCAHLTEAECNQVGKFKFKLPLVIRVAVMKRCM